MRFFGNKSKHETKADQIQELSGHPLAQRFLNGIDCDEISDAYGDFGRTLSNPIPVNGPIGEIKYLSRLRLHDNPTMFHRLTSTHFRNVAEEGVDVYELCDFSGQHWDILYLHMYHPRRSEKIPSLYTLAEYHPAYTRLPVGMGTNDFVGSFPYLLGPIFEKKYGAIGDLVGLRKVYSNLFQEEKNYFRPIDHFIRILRANNVGSFFEELITFIALQYPNSYFIDLLRNTDPYAYIAALKAIIAKGEGARECLNAVVELDSRTDEDSVSELIADAINAMSPQVVRGIPLLIEGLYDQEDPDRVDFAIGVLRVMGYIALPFLKPLLVDDDPRIRAIAKHLSLDIHNKVKLPGEP